ncbi:MAG: hypothetical protein FWF84_04840, partial [Kiritimatiellaeota bacterium]|nr:hypothetical protein [Kiritimatiellota bacterium]
MKKTVMIITAAVLAMGARADEPPSGSESVVGYSWLQLQDTTPFVGADVSGMEIITVDSSACSAQDSSMWEFRFGKGRWIPSYLLTGNGARDYWAGVMFAQPRIVNRVEV